MITETKVMRQNSLILVSTKIVETGRRKLYTCVYACNFHVFIFNTSITKFTDLYTFFKIKIALCPLVTLKNLVALVLQSILSLWVKAAALNKKKKKLYVNCLQPFILPDPVSEAGNKQQTVCFLIQRKPFRKS